MKRVFWVPLLMFTAGAGIPAQPAPPWSQGRNDSAADRGTVFRVDDIDNPVDLHGNPEDARLVLFIGGNEFMVLPDLIAAFERRHPDLRGRIFYETLPPGILRRQLASAGRLTLGNLTLQVQADVYQAGAGVLEEMEKNGEIEERTPYASNQLEIMVRAGNPLHIASLRDLGGARIRLSMPNPAWEGVARQIAAALRRSGGEELLRAVLETKVKDGTTRLTEIHHRQTAMRILAGLADAGVTWTSEVRFQRRIGNPIAGVAIPAAENTAAVSAAGILRQSVHRDAARAWVSFLASPEAQSIYRGYGFGPAHPSAASHDQSATRP